MIFVNRVGTIILALTVLLWFLSTFPAPPSGFTGPAIDYSYAGRMGHMLAKFFAPIGFNWQISIALVPGMAAREVAVAALGTVYAIQGGGENTQVIGPILAHSWSLGTALSLLVWYIFAPQCASTLAVIRRETGGWTWMWVTFGYMLALAYLGSLITYQVAVLLGAG
ncbi:ferrous iron transport protein B [mine drainage metagenome]|uniref:Ferrous iron transport protein B n=1 Tax=mine drainage metagenome TaxID=410659 RepID=A0A1J5PTD8_9ZZZZ